MYLSSHMLGKYRKKHELKISWIYAYLSQELTQDSTMHVKEITSTLYRFSLTFIYLPIIQELKCFGFIF